MKVAIPTKNDYVDPHFGHCPYFTVYTIDENNNITNTELIASPQGCGCKSNISEILMKEGVKIMLAGNMGDGALHTLSRFGIQAIRGCAGPVDKVIKDWLDGRVKDSGEGCEHHGHGGSPCN